MAGDFYPTSMTPEQAEAIAPPAETYGADAIGDVDRWHPLAVLVFALLLSIAFFWLPLYIGVRAIGRATGWF